MSFFVFFFNRILVGRAPTAVLWEVGRKESSPQGVFGMPKRRKVFRKKAAAKKFSRDVRSVAALNMRGAPMRGGIRL